MENLFTPIIGMEIHVELKTNSKMFCGCKNDPFHAPKPNIYTCPVCLGLPGALPVANKKAVEWTIKLGLALHCEIPLFSKFDRKNYFYPDLPKGYQISQYDQPLAINGWLEIPFRHPERSEGSPANAGISDKLRDSSAVPQNDKKMIRIRRVHLEEDTAKLQHTTLDGPTSPSGLRGASKKVSLIDFNRSGVPLVEIVTEPDIRTSDEAREFLKKLHQIIRYLDISDAEMEKGSMRLEPNISLLYGEKEGEIPEEELPKYKVEVKNINSFNFVKKAIDFELARHKDVLTSGYVPDQETRGWDEKKGVTYTQRKKESAHDYRYFPDPDLPPMRWEKSQISNLKSQIPELPDAKITRFVTDYSLPQQYAELAASTRKSAEMFESVVKEAQKINSEIMPKAIADWIFNKKIDLETVKTKDLVQQIVAAKTKVASDPKIVEAAIEKIIQEQAKAISDYKSGKVGVLMFLVGQVMKELKGKGNAQEIRKLLEKELE